jgi:DNA-binding response OmpR family regulator
VRVLLVEDESRLAETVRRGLAAEGFVVDVEHDGVDGLAAAATGDFDVVVLDIMLPGLSGYQVLRELRARQVWTPVLMLSAKDGEYDLADAFDIGADDYLTKPFSFVVLVARLRALLRRGAPERPTVLTAGTLSLDPAPIERIVTTADGVRLAVCDHHPSRAKATVVLLHGLCLTQASWSLQVRYLTRRWGPHIRILTLDR